MSLINNYKKNKIMKYSKLVLIIVFIFNTLGFIIGNIIYEEVSRVNRTRVSESFEVFKYKNEFEELGKLYKEKVSIPSVNGYNLSGTYIHNSKETKDSVVIVHGLGCTRWVSLKYCDIFLSLGYNVLIYDSRFHGNSGGKNITMGYKEKYDLNSAVNWLRDKNCEGIVGIHGESLGAATAILHSEMNTKNKNVDFYIVDCPYSDLEVLINEILKKNLSYYTPAVGRVLTFYCNSILFIRSGFTLKELSPMKAIEKSKSPILFIHAENDKVIPSYMSKEIYNSYMGKKDIYIAPNAGHCQSYTVNKEEYFNKVKSFLISIGL
jgi:uncharacterized protein